MIAALLFFASFIWIAVDASRRPRYRQLRVALATCFGIASVWCLVSHRRPQVHMQWHGAPAAQPRHEASVAPAPVAVPFHVVPQIGHSSVHALAFSEDCRLLASRGDEDLKIWDTATGVLRATWQTDDGGDQLEWSRDARVLKSWHSSDQKPRLWDARTGGAWKGPTPAELGPWFDPQPAAKRKRRAGWEVVYSAVAYSPGGRMVAFHLDHRVQNNFVDTLQIWDGRRARRMATLRVELNGVFSWSRDGRRLAFAIPNLLDEVDRHAAVKIRVWDRDRGRARTVFRGHAYDFALSPDGRNLVVSRASFSPGFEVVDVRSGKSLAMMEDGRGHLLAFCPTGKLLAASAGGGSIQIWDLERRALLRTLPGRRNRVEHVAFSSDGHWLFARVRGENDAHVWGLGDGGIHPALRETLRQEPTGVPSPDGLSFASAPGGGAVQIWDARTGEPRLGFAEPEGRVVELAWSPVGNRLIAATEIPALNPVLTTLKAWDAETGKRLPDLELYTDGTPFVLSPDGRTIAVGLGFETSLIDVATWTERARLASPCDDLSPEIAFSPDGETLAVAGCGEAIIQFRDVRSGALRTQIPARDQYVRSIAYHPNGSTLAIAGWHGLRLHRLSDGASLTLTALAGSDGQAVGLVTAEDGRWCGNPFGDLLRLRRAGADLQRAEMPAAQPLPGLGWRPSLLADFLAGRP